MQNPKIATHCVRRDRAGHLFDFTVKARSLRRSMVYLFSLSEVSQLSHQRSLSRGHLRSRVRDFVSGIAARGQTRHTRQPRTQATHATPVHAARRLNRRRPRAPPWAPTRTGARQLQRARVDSTIKRTGYLTYSRQTGRYTRRDTGPTAFTHHGPTTGRPHEIIQRTPTYRLQPSYANTAQQRACACGRVSVHTNQASTEARAVAPLTKALGVGAGPDVLISSGKGPFFAWLSSLSPPLEMTLPPKACRTIDVPVRVIRDGFDGVPVPSSSSNSSYSYSSPAGAGAVGAKAASSSAPGCC